MEVRNEFLMVKGGDDESTLGIGNFGTSLGALMEGGSLMEGSQKSSKGLVYRLMHSPNPGDLRDSIYFFISEG